MSLDYSEVAGRYAQAWAERDPDAIVALHTEDTIFHVTQTASPPFITAQRRHA